MNFGSERSCSTPSHRKGRLKAKWLGRGREIFVKVFWALRNCWIYRGGLEISGSFSHFYVPSLVSSDICTMGNGVFCPCSSKGPLGSDKCLKTPRSAYAFHLTSKITCNCHLKSSRRVSVTLLASRSECVPNLVESLELQMLSCSFPLLTQQPLVRSI